MVNPNYKVFLDILQGDLLAIFEHQKEYVCCKEGCSLCCESGNYPITNLEAEFLKEGYTLLPEELKKEISLKITKLKENPQEMYECPFLINKRCSVYEHRPLICRTFGLIQKQNDGKTVMAFCRELGLNYAKVFDFETQKIDYEKVKELGYKNIPQAYLIGLKNLMSKDFLGDNKLEFGEIKSLIDWL